MRIPLRLAIACLNGVTENLPVVTVYAPIPNAEEEIKDSFYEHVLNALHRSASEDMPTAAGNWNARSGAADMTKWHILGKLAVSPMCAKGAHLVNYALAKHLVNSISIQYPQ